MDRCVKGDSRLDIIDSWEDEKKSEEKDSYLIRLDLLEKKMNRMMKLVEKGMTVGNLFHNANDEEFRKTFFEEPSKKEKVIEDVMDNFNFEQVQKVMDFLDWKWYISGSSEVPTVETLRKEARRLLDMAFQSAEKKEFNDEGFREETVASGGLEAYARNDENGSYFSELRFIVEDFSSDSELLDEEDDGQQ